MSKIKGPELCPHGQTSKSSRFIQHWSSDGGMPNQPCPIGSPSIRLLVLPMEVTNCSVLLCKNTPFTLSTGTAKMAPELCIRPKRRADAWGIREDAHWNQEEFPGLCSRNDFKSFWFLNAFSSYFPKSLFLTKLVPCKSKLPKNRTEIIQLVQPKSNLTLSHTHTHTQFVLNNLWCRSCLELNKIFQC